MRRRQDHPFPPTLNVTAAGGKARGPTASSDVCLRGGAARAITWLVTGDRVAPCIGRSAVYPRQFPLGRQPADMLEDNCEAARVSCMWPPNCGCDERLEPCGTIVGWELWTCLCRRVADGSIRRDHWLGRCTLHEEMQVRMMPWNVREWTHHQKTVRKPGGIKQQLFAPRVFAATWCASLLRATAVCPLGSRFIGLYRRLLREGPRVLGDVVRQRARRGKKSVRGRDGERGGVRRCAESARLGDGQLHQAGLCSFGASTPTRNFTRESRRRQRSVVTYRGREWRAGLSSSARRRSCYGSIEHCEGQILVREDTVDTMEFVSYGPQGAHRIVLGDGGRGLERRRGCVPHCRRGLKVWRPHDAELFSTRARAMLPPLSHCIPRASAAL